MLAAATTARRYLRLVGLRGLTAAVSGKFHHRTTVLSVKRPEIRAPFFLRLPSPDLIVYRQIFFDLEYDFDVAVQPLAIIDAGAHIGLASIYLANRFPAARILAIEPEQDNFALLCRNVSPYANVVPINAALWKEDGELDVVDPGLGNWGFRTQTGSGDRAEAARARHAVRAVSLASLMREHGLAHIDILKVDIEGAEREVFGASQDWIDRVGAVIVELHDRFEPGCEQSLLRATAGFGASWRKGENLYVARPESGLRPRAAGPDLH